MNARPSGQPGPGCGFPFTAVVGMDELRLALVLNAVSPGRRRRAGARREGHREVDRGARAGRGAAADVDVVAGCRFSCDPADARPGLPGRPARARRARARTRPARLVELPVGATEDRLRRLAGPRAGADRGGQGVRAGPAGRGAPRRAVRRRGQPAARPPGRPAAGRGRAGRQLRRAGRGLGAARGPVPAGRHHEPGGGRAAPAAARPVRADRRGGRAARPGQRAEVVRRRLAYDADPDGFRGPLGRGRAGAGRADRRRPGERCPQVRAAATAALRQIAAVCAAFEVDGLRADIVTARAAVAHAAWQGRTEVTPRTSGPRPGWPCRTGAGATRSTRRPGRAAAGATRCRRPPVTTTRTRRRGPGGGQPGRPRAAPGEPAAGPGSGQPRRREPRSTGPRWRRRPRGRGHSERPIRPASATGSHGRPHGRGPATAPRARPAARAGAAGRRRAGPRSGPGGSGAGDRRRRAPAGVARPGAPPAGHRGAARPAGRLSRLHLAATLAAAAPHQAAGPDRAGRAAAAPRRPAEARREGREGNLVLFVVDASGSMAARERMGAVKGAVLSLLLDAYQRRDKVGLITFRGSGGAGAAAARPPRWRPPRPGWTSCRPAAARRWPRGCCARTGAATERLRDPRRRPLLVVVTDGRATGGAGHRGHRPPGSRRAGPLRQPLAARDRGVVVDCETGTGAAGPGGRAGPRAGRHPARLDELAAGPLADSVRALSAVPGHARPRSADGEAA